MKTNPVWQRIHPFRSRNCSPNIKGEVFQGPGTAQCLIEDLDQASTERCSMLKVRFFRDLDARDHAHERRKSTRSTFRHGCSAMAGPKGETFQGVALGMEMERRRTADVERSWRARNRWGSPSKGEVVRGVTSSPASRSVETGRLHLPIRRIRPSTRENALLPSRQVINPQSHAKPRGHFPLPCRSPSLHKEDFPR